MKWFFNWIASILAIYISTLLHDMALLVWSMGIMGLVFIVIFSAGTASLGYGGAFLLEKLIMKGNKYKNWVFVCISVPLSSVLSVFITVIIFGIANMT